MNMQKPDLNIIFVGPVSVKCILAAGAVLPKYQTSGSAGADVCACLPAPLLIPPAGRALVGTGVFFEIPDGYEIQLRPRSGLAVKHGVTCLNAPGTIDSDYRGEVKVILINHGSEDFIVSNGDRIAQLVIAPVLRAGFVHGGALSATDRGDGGFGSTGK